MGVIPLTNGKVKYYLIVLLNFALSMVLALSVFVLTFSVGIIGMFSSSSFVESKLQSCQQQAIEGFSTELEKYDGKVDVPIEVMTKSITQRDINVIFSTVTKNFLYSYSTRFSDNDDLYNSIKSSMTEYCNTNGISASDADVSKAACLAVDAANEYFGGSATANVRLFKLAQSKIMVYLIVIPAVLLVASIVILDLVNYGRHRKYSYIGMGIVTAGYLLVLVPTISNLLGPIGKYKFCDNYVYNLAVKSCWTSVVQIAITIGAVAIAFGVVMLFRNYRYFKNKNVEFTAVKETNAQLRNEYIEELEAKRQKDSKTQDEPHTKEKILLKIDFDDK